MPAGAAKIEVPRWIQLVGLPLLLLLLWVVAGAVRHVVFLFLVAFLVAMLLSPLVRLVERVRLPRGFAVALVYLVFAVVLVAAIGALGTVLVNETKTAAKRVDSYFTDVNGQTHQVAADRDVDRLQAWLNTHGLRTFHVQKRGHQLVHDIRKHDIGKYTNKVVDFLEGAAISIGKLLFALIVLIVVSVYMLLDLHRFGRAIDRRFPPHPGSDSLLVRMEQSLVSYVKGQALVSLIIGTTAGVGIWVLGAIGALPGGEKYALVFGAWVAITELIPYLGPWLGAIPPFIYAFVVHPLSAVWVALLFLGIHQIEGHVVVPKVMGSALRLHPLLVIFGLLAGEEIYGLPGVLVALPLLAAGRAVWEFFAERVELEKWEDGGVPPVEVLEEAPPPPPAAAQR
ncbi:MAG TPA: AI-2E family transporter [Gaiellaceae bacterium]|nr:AI-2E family transporter [Gaiellaceae bacterium]